MEHAVCVTNAYCDLFLQAATEVYQDLVMSGVVANTAGGGRPGRSRALERTGSAGERERARGTTTDLRDGWMASPMLGQAFRPEALDRCPRGVLQVKQTNAVVYGSCGPSWLDGEVMDTSRANVV